MEEIKKDLSKTIEIFRYKEKKLDELGLIMFKLDTEKGLPSEFFIDDIENKFNFNRKQIAYIIFVYQAKKMEHLLKSGIGKARQIKQQKNNRKTLIRYLEEGQYN